jgi:transcriptional regulator with XRE-family HTH domain
MMNPNPMSYTIRAKKLGVLLYDARIASSKSIKDCADILGISGNTIKAYENGDKSPSLPELEVFAFLYNVPIEHFWGQKIISETPLPVDQIDIEKMIVIRQRIISTIIRQEIEKKGLSINKFAEIAGIPSSHLKKYFSNEDPIPLPELEGILEILGLPIETIFAKSGTIGSWRLQKQNIEKYLQLPPEVQEFVIKPVNRPYIELAMRLNEMSVDRLRSVAEGLLEITL